METLITIAIIAVPIIIFLVLIGRSTLEKLYIPPVTPQDKELTPGMHRVEYKSQGKKLVGNLFIPADYKEGERRPGIAFGPPNSSLKEHSAGFYAEKFSKLGYVTLAFDSRGLGESEGISADANPFHLANDIASSISFLASQKQVDSDKLFNVALCAGSTGTIYETFQDKRIKALGLIVPTVNGAELVNGTNPLVRVAIYFIQGIFMVMKLMGLHIKMKPGVPALDKIPNDGTLLNKGLREVATYYLEGSVGYHPRWENAMSGTSLAGIAKMHPFDYSDKYDDIPVFLATGKEAYSLEPALRFYNSLNGPKDSLILEGTNHVEFYWKDENGDQAAEALDKFFKKHA